MTATESPRPTPPVLIAAPMPGHHAAAQQPGHLGRASGVDLGALAGGDQRLVGEGADAQRRATAPCRPSASSSGVALWVSKQYWGRPRRQARHWPHTARQLRTTKSPGATSVTPSPTDSTTPAASCPSRNGKSSLMPPCCSADRCGTPRTPGSSPPPRRDPDPAPGWSPAGPARSSPAQSRRALPVPSGQPLSQITYGTTVAHRHRSVPHRTRAGPPRTGPRPGP